MIVSHPKPTTTKSNNNNSNSYNNKNKNHKDEAKDEYVEMVEDDGDSEENGEVLVEEQEEDPLPAGYFNPVGMLYNIKERHSKRKWKNNLGPSSQTYNEQDQEDFSVDGDHNHTITKANNDFISKKRPRTLRIEPNNYNHASHSVIESFTSHHYRKIVGGESDQYRQKVCRSYTKCSCKAGGCLKLYCSCFSTSQYCTDQCQCCTTMMMATTVNRNSSSSYDTSLASQTKQPTCWNLPSLEYVHQRTTAIVNELTRDPNAFRRTHDQIYIQQQQQQQQAQQFVHPSPLLPVSYNTKPFQLMNNNTSKTIVTGLAYTTTSDAIPAHRHERNQKGKRNSRNKNNENDDEQEKISIQLIQPFFRSVQKNFIVNDGSGIDVTNKDQLTGTGLHSTRDNTEASSIKKATTGSTATSTSSSSIVPSQAVAQSLRQSLQSIQSETNIASKKINILLQNHNQNKVMLQDVAENQNTDSKKDNDGTNDSAQRNHYNEQDSSLPYLEIDIVDRNKNKGSYNDLAYMFCNEILPSSNKKVKTVAATTVETTDRTKTTTTNMFQKMTSHYDLITLAAQDTAIIQEMTRLIRNQTIELVASTRLNKNNIQQQEQQQATREKQHSTSSNDK